MARAGWKEKIVAFVTENGPSLHLAAAACGVSYSAVMKEKNKNPEYAQAIEDARQTYWDKLEETTIARCKREPTTRNLLKLLELRHPDYKKKSEIEFNGTIELNLFDGID